MSSPLDDVAVALGLDGVGGGVGVGGAGDDSDGGADIDDGIGGARNDILVVESEGGDRDTDSDIYGGGG